MTGLYLLLPTFFVIMLSFLVVRAAAIALRMTGMEEQRAKFQALSAFSGTGFTTREAEIVVNNPQRRRIVTWLMILENAGIITVIVSATSSVVTSEGYELPIAIAVLIVGLLIFYQLLKRTRLTRRWENFIEDRIIKSKILGEITTENLFIIKEDYGILRLIVRPNSSFIGKSLRDIFSQSHDLCVLGLERGKKWVQLPKADETIAGGDRVIIYGNLPDLHTILEKKPLP